MGAIAAYHVPLGGHSLGWNPLVTCFLHGARRSMVPLQTLRCFCLSCAHHDFTLDRHLTVWQRGHCHSQSISMQLEYLNGNVTRLRTLVPRGNETLGLVPYFLHPCERLALTYKKLTLLVMDVLLSFLFSTSPCPWRLAIPLDWFHTCFKTRSRRSVPKAFRRSVSFPRGTRVTYIT